MSDENIYRILVIDDNPEIHNDLKKILSKNDNTFDLYEFKKKIFNDTSKYITFPSFIIDSVTQGKDGVKFVKKSIDDNQPYALAFVDMRMPPGWNGIETIKHIWKIDKYIQIIICSAYSDYSWQTMIRELNDSDNFLILKKPFDKEVVCQMAYALAMKWQFRRQIQGHIKYLEEKNIAEQTFIANMSHEIRTPLNGIISMTNLLMQKNLPQEVLEAVKIINFSGEILTQIVNNILDFSKITAGLMQLDNSPFNFRELIQNVFKTIIVQAQNKDISFNLHIQQDIPNILLGDSMRIRQVLTNILNNAVKFTDQGSICLDIKMHAMEGQEVNLEFKISDTGIGIKPDVLKNIFHMYSQADSSISRKYGGSGLGLAISKRFIEMMNGKIEITSIVGKGSQFKFTLQLHTSNSLPEHSFVQAMQNSPNNNLDLKKNIHILLAEDNDINQKVAVLILKKLGYSHVDIVNNGLEVIQAFQNHSYDIILIDCQMPDMDGYIATKEIRLLEKSGKRIPIIAMTAYAMQGDREKCINAGMDDYITKPIDINQLDSTLDRWLNIS